MVVTTSCTNSSNFPKVKLVKNFNKLGVTCMVVRMSCTLTLGLIDYPSFSSNFANVKYSQVLTQAIATCNAIQSFVTISSSNSLSLLE
jgi:hypothetical protein